MQFGWRDEADRLLHSAYFRDEPRCAWAIRPPDLSICCLVTPEVYERSFDVFLSLSVKVSSISQEHSNSSRYFIMSSQGSSGLDMIDSTTIVSLAVVVMLFNSSYILSKRALEKDTPTSLRVLFIWHAFDFLIHIIFEGSFLYNCFFTSSPYDPAVHPASLVTNFLNAPDRLYGAAYGENWATKLWMVYAQADKRWAGADLTVVSLELLTVLGAGPLAFYICTGIARKDYTVAFWMIVLATAELYGGLFPFVFIKLD